MKILVISVGKKHDDSVSLGIAEFEKRISKYFEVLWKIIPSSDKDDVSSAKTDESKKIIGSLSEGDFVISLDNSGKQFETKELADFLEGKIGDSYKRLVFIIGGSYGLDKSVLERSDYIWSLSKLTFPHQLVRLILMEQIYRALSVIHGSKYHHQ